MEPPKGRQLKKDVLALLRADPFEPARQALREYPPRRVVNPLIGFFLHSEPRVRWRAITAMGDVVAPLADREMESARIIMRRLMWSLNDESGGIGWGAPEAMGEIMAQSASLASEYGRILLSYIDPRGNYLEHEALQRGVLWGIGRLAHARPGIVAPASARILPYLSSSDAELRGTAAWAIGPVLDSGFCAMLEALRTDETSFFLYRPDRFERVRIGDLAQTALDGARDRSGNAASARPGQSAEGP